VDENTKTTIISIAGIATTGVVTIATAYIAARWRVSVRSGKRNNKDGD